MQIVGGTMPRCRNRGITNGHFTGVCTRIENTIVANRGIDGRRKRVVRGIKNATLGGE